MNIFEIQEELRQVFDEIEELGGEITDEIAEKLAITEDAFKSKVESYVAYMKELDGAMNCIKDEQARLKSLYERKEKLRDKLESIVIQAVNEFGEVKKTGVKYYDYGTGSVSIRKSTAVKTNDDLQKYIGESISKSIYYSKVINTLKDCDSMDLDDIANTINEECATNLEGDELKELNMSLTVNIPLKDLQNGTGFRTLKEAINYSPTCKLSTTISKSEIKDKLKENGALTPNLAKLVINESLQIK